MKIKGFTFYLELYSQKCKNLPMINKKIILATLFTILFNGCMQSTAMLGPAYTLGSTGNTLQAGLSYGSNKAITKYKSIQKKETELRSFLKVRIEETRKKIKVIK